WLLICSPSLAIDLQTFPYQLRTEDVSSNGDETALKMSPRMVTKRLQINCQARQTDQQPPDQLPMELSFSHIHPDKSTINMTYQHDLDYE
ncbi:hypothetical protein T265_15121, partial [Opisthorchis viverrini]